MLVFNTFANILPNDVSAYICIARIFFVESDHYMIAYTELISDKLSIPHYDQLPLGEDCNTLREVLCLLQMMCGQNDRSVLTFDRL